MRNILNKVSLLFAIILCSLGSFAQEVTITGTVTQAGSGEGIIGANVVVEGTNIGTNTDINGRYTLKVPGTTTVVSFSYLGYITQRVTVGSNRVINIELKDQALSMEEVVVVGYGTQKKESVNGAISTLSTKELLKSPTSNMTQALSGKVAGLITSQGQGQPGYDDAKIYIRGRASFSGENEPLVLVDGVERSFSQISPDDVSQISVLKDASATAVYGVRGANGVILVTTKRGYEGKPEVSFTANFSMQTPTTLNKYLNSYNSVVLLEEALANDGLPSQYSAADVDMYRKAVTGGLSGDDYYRYPNVDWYSEVLRDVAPAQQYSVNVSGGTRRMRYFTSLSYFDQRGLYKPQNSDDYGQSSNARFQRYSFRANLDFLLTKMFTMSVNFGTRFENRKGPNVTEDAKYSEVFFELNRTPSWVFPVQWADGRYGGNAFAKNNIVGRLTEGGFYSKIGNTNETNVVLKHDLDFITKGLSVRAMGSFDYYTDYDHRFSKNFATYELLNKNGDLNNYDNFRKYNEDGLLTESTSPQFTSLKTYLEFGFNYERTFAERHNVTALALYNQNNYRWQGDIPFRYQGLVGRLTYNYDRRYFGEVNFGFNGSENFAKGRRFGFFPSFAAGWMISNEKFLEDVKWLDILKLRASYGEVGNDKFNDARFLYVSSWKQGGSYTFGDANAVNGVYEGRLPNSYVTWERARKSNVAVESTMFKGMLSMSADFFYEKRDDILAEYQTKPTWLAVGLSPANIGKVTNKGTEIEIKHTRNFTDFSYFVNAAFAVAKNNIVYKDEAPGMPSWQKREGRSINQFFGLVAEGFITTEDMNNPDMPKSTLGTTQVGDLKYRDINGDGFIDDRDATAIGYSDIPEQTYSLTVGGQWKGLSLSVMFQGVNNVSRYYDAEAMYAFVNGGKVRDHHMDRWNPNMSDSYNLANAKYPLLHYGSNGDHNQRLNSFFLQDASFIRLKNVEISYTLPSKLAQKLFTKDIRVYVNGNNLLTWDKLGKLTDPESTGSNVYPIMRVFNVGINIKF